MSLVSETKEREALKPGIYLEGGFERQDYHDDPALGSGDHRELAKGTASFWYKSKFNPMRPRDKDTPAKQAGSAVHKIVLEGMDAFRSEYVRRPDDAPDATGPQKAAVTKASNAAAEAKGRISLHGDVYDRTLLASAAIASDPDLATVFQGGIPEVAVVWDERGDPDIGPPVMCKALIDYLKVKGIGDLKSMANGNKMPFELAVRKSLRYDNLAIQAALYWRGRARFADFVRTGQIFGGTVDQHDLIKRCAASKTFGWQWVFYQREDAPEVDSWYFSSLSNPILRRAMDDVELNIERYQRALAEFGPHKLWAYPKGARELTPDDLENLYAA